jgi:hypothetical protein
VGNYVIADPSNLGNFMIADKHGIDSFVFGPAKDPVRQVQVFAAEVAPAVREAVARHRRTPTPA